MYLLKHCGFINNKWPIFVELLTTDSKDNSTTMVAILFKPQAGWRIFASSECVIIGSGKNESSVRRQVIT